MTPRSPTTEHHATYTEALIQDDILLKLRDMAVKLDPAKTMNCENAHKKLEYQKERYVL